MVKDKISLIAAAAGGFMLFVAISSILRGAPVTTQLAQHSFDSTKVADFRLQQVYAIERINGTFWSSVHRRFTAVPATGAFGGH